MTPALDDAAPVVLTTLDGGVRVVTEAVPSRSVAVGVFVGVGSRDEGPDEAGASHFLEHLLFKGTATRSARDLARSVDEVGGEMNADTTRERTAFYVRVPADELPLAVDLLVDVVAAPALRPGDVDAERDVILEELLQAEDAPDDVVHVRLWEQLFPHHPIGRETLGTPSSIERLDAERIGAFHRRWYAGDRLVVAAAGAVDHAAVVERVQASPLARRGPGASLTVSSRRPPTEPPAPLVVDARPTEQAHLALGWRGVSLNDDDRFAAHLANHVLGGGMSSRLFQEIREDRGLAYAVHSSLSLYADCGAATVYAGTSPEHLPEVLELVDRVLGDLLDGGVTDEELRTAKGYLRGSTLLGLEDSGSRMARLGLGMVARGRVMPVAEYLDRVDAVTAEEVDAVARRIFGGPRTLSLAGPVAESAPAVVAAVERGRGG